MKGSDILSSEKSIVSAAKSANKPANKEYSVSKLKKPMKIDMTRSFVFCEFLYFLSMTMVVITLHPLQSFASSR